MVDEPLFKDFAAALPVDVAAAAGEEAGDAVAAEVMDPAVVAELAHEGVDPGEASDAGLPALEPYFCLLVVDVVVACDETGFWIALGGEMPGDEATVRVRCGLSEGCAEGGVGGKVHVAEEDLTDEALGRGRGCFAVGLDDFVDAPVEETYGEGAEVEEWREKGCGLRVELCWACLWFLESCRIFFVFEEVVENLKGTRLAASMGSCCWGEAELLQSLNGEITIWTSNVVISRIFFRSIICVEIRFPLRNMPLEIHGHLPRIRQTLRRRNGLRNRPNLFTRGL